MINIKRNQDNTLYFTLNENITFDNPRFIMRLENSVDDNVIEYELSGDTSNDTTRYNSFVINEPSNIEFVYPSYDYFIYEVSNISTYVPDTPSTWPPSNPSEYNLIEKGMVQVDFDSISEFTGGTNNITLTSTTNNNSYKVQF